MDVNNTPIGVAVTVGVAVGRTSVAVRVAVGVPAPTIVMGSNPTVTGAPASSRNAGDEKVIV